LFFFNAPFLPFFTPEPAPKPAPDFLNYPLWCLILEMAPVLGVHHDPREGTKNSLFYGIRKKRKKGVEHVRFFTSSPKAEPAEHEPGRGSLSRLKQTPEKAIL